MSKRGGMSDVDLFRDLAVAALDSHAELRELIESIKIITRGMLTISREVENVGAPGGPRWRERLEYVQQDMAGLLTECDGLLASAPNPDHSEAIRELRMAAAWLKHMDASATG